MWTAAVLAGGAGRRAGGRDKSALVVGQETILARQLNVVSRITNEILIVASDGERYRSLGVRVVSDLFTGAGALGGICTALCAASTEQTLIIACDMPFLTAAFLAYVVDAGCNVDAAVPRTTAGLEPLCAVYASRCTTGFRRRIEAGALKVTDALTDLRVREIDPEEIRGFDPDNCLFFNVNTREDYLQACELAGRQVRRPAARELHNPARRQQE